MLSAMIVVMSLAVTPPAYDEPVQAPVQKLQAPVQKQVVAREQRRVFRGRVRSSFRGVCGIFGCN